MVPSYERHWALAMWACVVILLITYKLECLNSDIMIFVGGILIAARYISPDIDMKNTTAYRNWGVFRHMLIPYASMFAHRGRSHHPIWGPLTLIPYTFACFALITAFFITFCLPLINNAADYVCMVATSLKAGVIPPGVMRNATILVLSAIIAILLHSAYDAIGKGDRQA